MPTNIELSRQTGSAHCRYAAKRFRIADVLRSICRHETQTLSIAACFWILVLVAGQHDLRADETRSDVVFERQIWPILKAHCLDCHGADASDIKGQLDLRQKRRMETGGESGPAIVPGNAESSLLWQRVRDGEMPPGDHRVPEDQAALLQAWIQAGAPTLRPEPEQIPDGLAITEEELAFWSFQPIRRPLIPRWHVDLRARTPIDSLLLAPLQQAGLGFAADADRPVLMRRLYLDLLGIPPTPEEIALFQSDESADAYVRLVDRVLVSPRYGERWGRHWLDLAGFAESEGVTTADADRPFAYRYRDYVIRSWNVDKPYDDFLAEQLAGDELVAQPFQNLDAAAIEKLEATGFLRMAPDGTGSGANTEEGRNQTVADTVKMVSTSLLGLSVGCAQCHDHRYDPITQADYFRLRAIFAPALDWQNWRTPDQRMVSLATESQRAEAAAIEAQVAAVSNERTDRQREFIDAALVVELNRYPEPLRQQLEKAYRTPEDQRDEKQRELLAQNPSVNINGGNLYQYNAQAAEELKKFDARIAELRAKKPIEEFVRALTEVPGQVPTTHIFYRGDYRQPRDVVEPGPLTVIAKDSKATFDTPATAASTTGRRLAFARWLTRDDHPLTARVLANHLWMHHFGRGLVETPGDFGRLGQLPSHPELLDWLADELIRSGWSIKHLHRVILTSTVYRQASETNNERLALDPSNRWYGKWPVQRLDAEVVRDRMLAVSGQLSQQMYGPSVTIVPDKAGQIVVEGEDRRRSVYLRVQRTQPVSLLAVFDAPLMETNCDRRANATSPDQALMLMNGDFVLRQAQQLADRVWRDSDPSWPARVARAWWIVYGRSPDASELDAVHQVLIAASILPDGATDEQLQAAARQALVDVCQVLLGSNEFLYID